MISTTFNEYEYSPDTISELNQAFKESLQMVISHCTGKMKPKKRPLTTVMTNSRWKILKNY